MTENKEDVMKKTVLALATVLLAALGCGGCGEQPQQNVQQGEQQDEQQNTHGGGTQGGTPNEEKKEPLYTIDEELIGEDANGEEFSAERVIRRAKSPLKDKYLYWLGSSVTYGAASDGESMAEFLSALTGCTCKKEAVSGTTLADNGMDSYTRRMESGKVFADGEYPDLFICQISTNDCLGSRLSQRGEMTDSLPQSLADCHRDTTLGAVEYIIKYVTDTWGCPVYFYSGAYFGDRGVRSSFDPLGSEYGKLVAQVHEIAEKWRNYGYDVQVIDLYNDEAFNAAVSDEYYRWCTQDAIHPRKAGYLNWWTPYFEWYLLNNFI